MPRHDGCFLFAAQFANRNRLNLLSTGLLDDGGAGPFIDHGVVHDLDIRHVDGLVDDRSVIHHDSCRANWLKESAFLDQDNFPMRNLP